jgi:hypothetical protein
VCSILEDLNYDDRYIIGYASAFTDYCTRKTLGNKPDIIYTQCSSWRGMTKKAQKEIYAPFHFTGFDTADKLLRAAIKSKNPYRIGIALHTHADSFSHSRFTARWHEENRIINPFTPWRLLMPPICHFNAGLDPDTIGRTWWDSRTLSWINNNDVFNQAVYRIYIILKPDSIPKDLGHHLNFYVPKFDPHAWMNKKGHYVTRINHFDRFQNAAKEHLLLFKEIKK